MRRPPVIRLDRWVARTAFTLSDGGCGAGVASGNSILELRRAGCDELLATYAPLEVDDDGRLVFAWDDRIRCLEPGIYRARLVSQCIPCGEITIQLGGQCAVRSAENVDFGPECDGPDDTCSMSTTCGPVDACGCPPTPVIYVPPYDVPRGC